MSSTGPSTSISARPSAAPTSRIGGFDETMAQSEDLDLWVRLMMLGGRAYYANAVLGDYRVRPGSASSNSGRMLLGNIKVYEKARRALPDNAPKPRLSIACSPKTTALAFRTPSTGSSTGTRGAGWPNCAPPAAMSKAWSGGHPS
jgi:hypothetical protein